MSVTNKQAMNDALEMKTKESFVKDELIKQLKQQNTELMKQLEDANKVINFYANGGNTNKDIWHDEKLGYFTGKLAREYKAKYSKGE